MGNEGQVLSAVMAWTATLVLFVTSLYVVYRRPNVTWQQMLLVTIGSIMLALAGAIAATQAASSPASALPLPWLVVMVTARSIAASIFLGLLIMLTSRPRWLVRRMRRWLAEQGR